MSAVDIAEVIVIVLVFVISVGSFIYVATRP